MDSDFSTILATEQLVCYFEDGSFSVVPKMALAPFHPSHEPYTSYARSVKRFLNDEAVAKALRYWNDGEIPANFKWLRLLELGYCEKEASSANDKHDSGIDEAVSMEERDQRDDEAELVRELASAPVKKRIVKTSARGGKRTAAGKTVGRPPKKTGHAAMLAKNGKKSSGSMNTDALVDVDPAKELLAVPKLFDPAVESYKVIGHLMSKQPVDVFRQQLVAAAASN